MLNPENYAQIQSEIAQRIQEDGGILQELRNEVQILKGQVYPIHPRRTTAMSLVGTDGGNNQIAYDPFLIQLIRIVDSSDNQYFLDAVTPNTSIAQLNQKHLDDTGTPRSYLGHMMVDLNISHVTELSPMIATEDSGMPRSVQWIRAYRELLEWATLYWIITNKDFGTDTLLVFDGFLRSKVFAGELFIRLLERIEAVIDHHRAQHGRQLYLVGVAKRSKVFTRYKLAMALEHILTAPYPSYVEIPRELEFQAYRWAQYALGDDVEVQGEQVNKFVGGKLHFVKFGESAHDPIWPVDIFRSQVTYAAAVLCVCPGGIREVQSQQVTLEFPLQQDTDCHEAGWAGRSSGNGTI